MPHHEHPALPRGAATDDDDLKLLVGAEAISDALGITQRQVFHLLEIECLPGAFKLGKRLWAIRRVDLLRLGEAV